MRGDLHAALHALLRYARGLPRRERLAVLRAHRARVPAPPAAAAGGGVPRRGGAACVTPRSATPAAISHHYDVSNRFYEMVLGPSMAYTCAVFPSADATLEEAQAEKFDLVCRKLALEPGKRLLDVGRRLGRHGHARRRALRRPARWG